MCWKWRGDGINKILGREGGYKDENTVFMDSVDFWNPELYSAERRKQHILAFLQMECRW